MGNFLDFEEIKARVSFTAALQLLKLDFKKSGNQFRGPCPSCKGAERSLVITEGKGAFCFSAHKGGDVIWLTSHVQGCDVKQAAKLLADSSTVPQAKPASGDQEGGFQALAYLEHDHDAVKAIGFDVEFCKRVGIGYAGKGILRGSVAIPVRDETGKLLGYVGATDLTLPPAFMEGVVEFKKKA